MALFIKAKEALICRSPFLKLQTNFVKFLFAFFGFAHLKIKVVTQVLMTKVVIKDLGFDKINVQIL